MPTSVMADTMAKQVNFWRNKLNIDWTWAIYVVVESSQKVFLTNWKDHTRVLNGGVEVTGDVLSNAKRKIALIRVHKEGDEKTLVHELTHIKFPKQKEEWITNKAEEVYNLYASN